VKIKIKLEINMKKHELYGIIADDVENALKKAGYNAKVVKIE